MLHVTLPGMQSVIFLMTAMAMGNILNAGFDQVYNLYSASVYETGDIIDTYVYRVGLNSMQYSFWYGNRIDEIRHCIYFNDVCKRAG